MNEIRDIHQPFMAWLRKHGVPFHRQRSDKRTTGDVGDPDFIVTWQGRCVYVECKVPGGKLSPKQKERIAYLRAAGNTVYIVHSLEECIDAIYYEFGIEDNLSGGEAESERVRIPVNNEVLRPEATHNASTSPPSQYFIGKFRGADYVFSGTGVAGEECEIVRKATTFDMMTLKPLHVDGGAR